MRKMRKGLHRVLSVFLALLMMFSVVPTSAMAEEPETYEKISSKEEFTTGKYVMVVDTGYAVGPMNGTWVSAISVSPSGDTITNPGAAVVDLTVEGNSVSIQLSDGNTIAPPGGNNNGIQAGSYSWEWTSADGKFVFHGVGEDTVRLASNKR